MQRRHGLNFVFATQDAALELEILKAVARLRGLGQPHDGLGIHRLLMAQTQPVIAGLGLGPVRQVGQVAVTHVKKVAEHRHGRALLALAQQSCHWHPKKLAQ